MKILLHTWAVILGMCFASVVRKFIDSFIIYIRFLLY